MSSITIGVAMSGGVDSTVAASLLQEQGYQVHGYFMILPLPRLDAQLQRVQEVARQLAIPLRTIDLRRQFADLVLRYFVEAYRAGQTPNPCIYCNQTIKFGLLAEALRESGMERIATGHYARVDRVDDHYAVLRGVDRLKDQSYFLGRLAAAQLPHLVFPLGQWTKTEVYRRAEALGFHFQGEESQDVCFLSQSLAEFLAEQGLRDRVGPIVSVEGRHLGQHRGVWNYTIGQRRGLGLPDATPWYVVGIEGATNRLIVGKDKDLFHAACQVHSLQWTSLSPRLPWRGLVQLRSRHTPAMAQLTQVDAERWQLHFDTPQRAITPGQFAVFYEEDRVMGSAVIAAPAIAPGESRP